jgi:hypothetical protein
MAASVLGRRFGESKIGDGKSKRRRRDGGLLEQGLLFQEMGEIEVRVEMSKMTKRDA